MVKGAETMMECPCKDETYLCETPCCLDCAYLKGRSDAERDFQNSDYWNDYLANIIADTKADAIEEMFSKIDKLTVYYAGDKDGNAITPKMLVKEDVIKLLEQLKEQNKLKTKTFNDCEQSYLQSAT